MRASVVINVRSGRSERYVRAIAAMFAARGIEIDDFATVAGEELLRGRVKRAVKRGASLIAVGGGDGSMTTAVDLLANERAILGVLPLGTGNSFARTLGIPSDLARACDVIAARRVARVDLGVVNGVHFANFATIGLSSEIAAAAPRPLKRIVGPAAYVAGGLKAFFTHRSFAARIRWDAGTSRLRTAQIVVASGRFFGRQPVTPGASIVDQRLALFTTTGTSHAEVARMYAAFGLGLQTRLPDAVFFSSRTIAVKASPKQSIAVDGEARGHTPARFSVAARALRVCVPADFDDARD